jgi:hypothetical protein
MPVRNATASSIALSLCLVAGSALAADTKNEAPVKAVVQNEGAIRDKWTLADGVQLAAPAYPAEYTKLNRNVCLALGYLINPDGTTSDFKVLKQWNQTTQEKEPEAGFYEAFAKAGAVAVAQWQFKPRPEVAQPVETYTVATLSFQANREIDAAQLRQPCQIPNLAAFMEIQRKKDMNDANIERGLRRDDDALRKAVSVPGSGARGY